MNFDTFYDHLWWLLFYALTVTVVCGVLYIVAMAVLSDERPDQCFIVHRARRPDLPAACTWDTWSIRMKVDWGSDLELGPYLSEAEAKSVAAESGCPVLGEGM